MCPVLQQESVVVPLPSPRDRVRVATEVRSTLLCTSLKALRTRGYFSRYLDVLERPLHDTILSLVGGEWLPVDVAVAHYLACDRLELPLAVIEEIGSEVGRRVNESVVSVLVRATRELGATPWSALAHLPKLNDRLFRGGAFTVIKSGPKDARIEWLGQPCARSTYFQRAFATHVASVCDLFCTKAYARRLPEGCSGTALAYRLSWA
jgi:hypothetical protein